MSFSQQSKLLFSLQGIFLVIVCVFSVFSLHNISEQHDHLKHDHYTSQLVLNKISQASTLYVTSIAYEVPDEKRTAALENQISYSISQLQKNAGDSVDDWSVDLLESGVLEMYEFGEGAQMLNASARNDANLGPFIAAEKQVQDVIAQLFLNQELHIRETEKRLHSLLFLYAVVIVVFTFVNIVILLVLIHQLHVLIVFPIKELKNRILHIGAGEKIGVHAYTEDEDVQEVVRTLEDLFAKRENENSSKERAKLHEFDHMSSTLNRQMQKLYNLQVRVIVDYLQNPDKYDALVKRIKNQSREVASPEVKSFLEKNFPRDVPSKKRKSP